MKVYQELCKKYTTFRERSGASRLRRGGAGLSSAAARRARPRAAGCRHGAAPGARAAAVCLPWHACGGRRRAQHARSTVPLAPVPTHPININIAENVDVAVEVSLQPWRAFQPDGVILFSDILTFLP